MIGVAAFIVLVLAFGWLVDRNTGADPEDNYDDLDDK